MGFCVACRRWGAGGKKLGERGTEWRRWEGADNLLLGSDASNTRGSHFQAPTRTGGWCGTGGLGWTNWVNGAVRWKVFGARKESPGPAQIVLEWRDA